MPLSPINSQLTGHACVCLLFPTKVSVFLKMLQIVFLIVFLAVFLILLLTVFTIFFQRVLLKTI